MIFQASLANAQMLIPSSQGGVSSILLEGRTLLALATTVYGPGGIDQVLPEPLSPCAALVRAVTENSLWIENHWGRGGDHSVLIHSTVTCSTRCWGTWL